jgi:cell division protein FtsA
MEEFAAGLDIGTTKIRVAAGDASPGGGLNITAVGEAESRGVRRGMIADMESAVRAVSEAADEAERQCGREIRKVAAGISGEHIESINADGLALITEGRVKSSDIDSAVENAEKLFVPSGREILHAIPTGYRIDEQREVAEPVGMYARHLEVSVHFITAALNPLENFTSCVRSAGFEIESLTFQPLAPVYGVLSEDEKDIGAVLLDIGGGTTGIAVIGGGSARRAGVLALGGESITSDLSLCLQLSRKAAENLKIKHGRASADACGGGKIKIPGADSPVPLKFISEIIEARVDEIFELASREISKSPSAPGCGLVLTGGGSLLEGMREKAERFFGMPTRLGTPAHNVSGLEKYGRSPAYSAAAGLAGLCLLERRKKGGAFFTGPGMFGGINRRMKTWFRDML